MSINPQAKDSRHGHRQRLRERLLETGSVADYELLEMLLFAANPRGDTKPLAKTLLCQFVVVSGLLRTNYSLIE